MVFASVAFAEQGVASGTNNAFRELGGTMGVAVLGSVFSAAGSFATPAAFVDGLRPALAVGTAVLALGAVAALLIPGRRPAAPVDDLVTAPAAQEPVPIAVA